MGLFDYMRKKKPEASLPKLSRTEFARRIMDAVQASGLEGLSYNETEFSLTISQRSLRFFLGNAYAEYLAEPDSTKREQIIDRYVQHLSAGLPEAPEDWESVKDALLPMLRTRIFLQRLDGDLLAEEEKKVPWQVVAESLALGLAHDTPTALKYANVELLRKCGATYEQAMAQALDNLAARSSGDFIEQSPGLFRSPWNDCYDCARLVLPDVLKRLKLAGQPIVTVPHWNAMYVADSDNASALQSLASVTESEMAQPRANNTPALIFENGAWQPYLPPEDHPAYAPLARLRKIARLRDYADETPHLQKRLSQSVYVALAGSLSPKANSMALSTYASWGDGIATLLPKVDWIALVDTSAPKDKSLLGLFAWNDVAEVVPGLQTPALDHFPPYFKVEKFPSRGEIEQLKPMPR
jgi:uncharacterized protein YtpQ (UPF0354 family)